MDVEAYGAALREHRYLPRVLEQEREAHELGIHSVPSVILGDCLIPGCVPYETLVRAARVASGEEPVSRAAARPSP